MVKTPASLTAQPALHTLLNIVSDPRDFWASVVHMVVMISLVFPLRWKGGVLRLWRGGHVRSTLVQSPVTLDHHCLKSRAGAIRADHFLFPLPASQRDLSHELRPAEIKTWIIALTGAGTLKWKPVLNKHSFTYLAQYSLSAQYSSLWAFGLQHQSH